MEFFRTGFDNNSTYYEHNINTVDIPNVFIHGVGLNHTIWLPQKKYFKNKKIVFYDLLNHGKSSKGMKKIDFDNFSLQLLQLLNFLNIKKCNLIGFSIGALIAQHFTAKHFEKINKLVIIASVYKRTEHQINKVKNRFKNALNNIDISDDSIKRWFNQKYLDENPNVYSFFDKILKNNKKEDFLPAYKLFVESDNYKLNFKNFTMPTLIMTGENEIGSTPEMSENLHQQIKDSELFIISKAKHMASYEKSKVVNDTIYNFLY